MTLKRTSYFEGQLLRPDDLAQDQMYFREKARRHNRTFHGWGVVCGLEVAEGQGASEVLIAPGYALDPYGEEILIEREVTIDLSKEDRDGKRLYLAVAYAESYEDPVPVAAGGSEATEYSRVRDSFAIKVLTELPATYSPSNSPPHGPQDAHSEPEASANRSLQETPSGPWVILADVVLDANLSVASIDTVTHRRYLGSVAL